MKERKRLAQIGALFSFPFPIQPTEQLAFHGWGGWFLFVDELSHSLSSPGPPFPFQKQLVEEEEEVHTTPFTHSLPRRSPLSQVPLLR